MTIHEDVKEVRRLARDLKTDTYALFYEYESVIAPGGGQRVAPITQVISLKGRLMRLFYDKFRPLKDAPMTDSEYIDWVEAKADISLAVGEIRAMLVTYLNRNK